MKRKNEEISIKEIFEILRPKRWIILLISFLCAAVAFVYSEFIKDERYTSTSLVYVYSDTQQNTTTNDLNVAVTMVDVYKVMLTTDTFLTPVLNALPDEYDSLNLKPSHVKGMISIQQVETTQIIKVSVTSTNKQLAYDIACKIVELAPGQLDTIVPNGLSVVTIEYPVMAETHNSKNEVRNSVIAFLIAFIISACVVWIRAVFDVKIRDTEDIETKIDTTVLGTIPTHEVDSLTVGGIEK